MGKTWRRNDRFRPKKDKGENKSRKLKDFEDDYTKHRRPQGEDYDAVKTDIDELLKDLGEE